MIIEVPAIQKVEKSVENPQIQYIDKIIGVPVKNNFEKPMIRKVQKTAEVHQIKYIVKIIDMPVQIQRQMPNGRQSSTLDISRPMTRLSLACTSQMGMFQSAWGCPSPFS